MTESLTTQPIKLVAIDLDGTLLNSQHQMTERVEKTIKAAMEQGTQVVLATGKTYHAAEWLYETLKLNLPGVFIQGTAIYNSDGSLHSQQTITSQIARQIITFADDRGYLTGMYSGNRILVRKMHPRIEELTAHYHEPMPEAVGPLQNVLDSLPVNKLLVFAPHEARRITALRWHISMQINGGGRSLQTGIGDELEILPARASKGAMLKVLLKDLGVPASQVMAIGDGENDVEMLQMVGLGVAMGNAPETVKAAAKTVVASNDADGVAEALERFVLKLPHMMTASKVEAKPA
jgi:Cof subfamily protein (haloacid dehalogenase superfamily)